MSSFKEGEPDELLRRQIIGSPRKFDIENPREFQGKFGLPVDTVIYLLEFEIGQQSC